MPHPPQSHLEQYAGYSAAQIHLQNYSQDIHPPMIWHPPMMPSVYQESSTMDHQTSRTFQIAPTYDSLSNSTPQAQPLQANTSSVMDRPVYENTSPHTQVPPPTYYNLPTNSAPLTNPAYQQQPQPQPQQQQQDPHSKSTADQRHASFDGSSAVALAQPPMQSWGNPYDLSTVPRPIWPISEKFNHDDPW